MQRLLAEKRDGVLLDPNRFGIRSESEETGGKSERKWETSGQIQPQGQAKLSTNENSLKD